MKHFPQKLNLKLEARQEKNTLRNLSIPSSNIDFSSNDYLGFAHSKIIFDRAHHDLIQNNNSQNGATGSRLLSGNHSLYDATETLLANYHRTEAALLFNSGYDANLGVFSSILQREDTILYDEFIHASIRDGIRLSNAKNYKFSHNDLDDLRRKLDKFIAPNQEVYVVTESVFSMDGDSPDITELFKVCNNKKAHLIIDEAHAVGVFGPHGNGLLSDPGTENTVFARIITFGKALGCHGAAVLGSEALKNYLINFARSFIYTTGLPPHSLATIQSAYQELKQNTESRITLQRNIAFFNQEIQKLKQEHLFIPSNSAIHCAVIPGNARVKKIALQFQNKGFDIKPILSPTVPEGQERIRFCLHSYNSFQEITDVLSLLTIFVTQ